MFTLRSHLLPKYPHISFFFRYFCTSDCFKCNSRMAQPWLCNSCNHLQLPDQKNDYFALLKCERRFDISPTVLSKNFLQLQKLAHPDRFHSKGEAERKKAAVISSLLNSAYKTLKNPVDRAKYLLELNGVEFDENIPPPGPDFLYEMMEIREKIETAENKELYELKDIMQIQLDDYCKQLSTLFNEISIRKDTIIEVTSRLVYVDNVLAAINERLPSS